MAMSLATKFLFYTTTRHRHGKHKKKLEKYWQKNTAMVPAD